LFRIAREFKQPLHESLKDLSIYDYPYSIQFVIHKRMQVESWLELPEDKQPPKDIWYKPSELKEWFDRVYGKESTQIEFKIDEREMEG
jgi:hypothetical protein